MRHGIVALSCLSCLSITSSAWAQASIEQVLGFKPVIAGVDVEQADPAKCKVQPVTATETSKVTGYTAIGPQGQTLRKFLDVNQSMRVNEFRYYKDGLEVYREMDTNSDGVRDEFRWLNTGGSRWGVDRNQNGVIDGWKLLSAEEASREAVRACISQNSEALQALLITDKDLQSLGADKAFAAKVLEGTKDAVDKVRKLFADSKAVSSETQWLRFDSVMPHLIPGEEGRTKGDVLVYENVMAFVETGGKTGFVQIGELVRVGEVWKLTQTPRPIEGDGPREIETGWFITPSHPELAGLSDTAFPEEMKKLIDELSALDARAKGFGDAPAPAEFAKFNRERAALLIRLAEAARKNSRAEDYSNFLKQAIDGILAAVQMDSFPEGVKTLVDIEKSLGESSSPLLPYVTYRRMLAEYSTELKAATKKEEQDAAQATWLKGLEGFVKKYAEAEDSPDALIQLGTTFDLMGRIPEAKTHYTKILKEYPMSRAAARATGSLRRLTLQGQKVVLNGPGLTGDAKDVIDIAQYKGKVVLVVFWATWAKSFIDDLPSLLDLHSKQRSRGFEIIGVNVDTADSELAAFSKQNSLPWQNIREVGGLEEGRLAVGYGILSLPTMFVVNKDGQVEAVTSSLSEVKKMLPDLLK